MLQIPNIDSLDLTGKRVLVRGDLDIDIKPGEEPERLEALVQTLKVVLEKNPKQIAIIGHRGRPASAEAPSGKPEGLSIKPLVSYFQEKLNSEIEFVEDPENYYESDKKIRLLENLRFWPGEEANSEDFARRLAAFGDIYINEAFGNSHREHASMVMLPKLLPHAAGVQLMKEIENLSKILENPARPLVFIISGVKEDKIKYIDKFKTIADKVLVGGRLPKFLGDEYADPKVVVARLMPDNEDITMHYIEHFEGEVKRAKTVVVSGPLGKFEEEGHRQGTERVFKAVADSNCFSVAGGGDTEEALELLGLEDKIDWVSTGGGAMLEFLSEGTLPGIKALLE
jgi:phosphoglycerate kinase